MHFKGLTESKKGREIQNAFASADRKRKELLTRFQAAFESYMQVRSGATLVITSRPCVGTVC